MMISTTVFAWQVETFLVSILSTLLSHQVKPTVISANWMKKGKKLANAECWPKKVLYKTSFSVKIRSDQHTAVLAASAIGAVGFGNLLPAALQFGGLALAGGSTVANRMCPVGSCNVSNRF